MNGGQRYRVRPWLRTTGIVAFVFLTPIVAHAIWDLIEARRLSAVVEAIRARGETVHWNTWQPGTPSPEEKAAARHYTAAAVLVRDAWSARLREINNTITAIAGSHPREAARDSRLDQLQRVLDEYAPALDLLDRASALAVGPIRSGDELRYPVPDQNLANVNAVRIARLSFLGNTPGAVMALSETLRLRNVSSFWPLGVDTSSSLRLLLMFAPPDAAVLTQLQELYGQITDEKQVEKDLLDRRARLITGVWPAASGPMAVVPRVMGTTGIRAPLFEVILRPWLTQVIRRRILEFDEALPVAREPWPRRLDMALALAAKYPEPPRDRSNTLFGSVAPGLSTVSRMNMAAFEVSNSAKRAAREAARQRVAVTVLAIERFRRAQSDALPADFAALVPQYLDAVPIDPFTGAALKFTRSNEGYRVYSVGLNRTDEGGDWSNDAPKQTPSPTTSFEPKDIGIDIRRF